MERPPYQAISGNARFDLASFVIDLERRQLLDAHGTIVPLRPQAYAVLHHLVLNAGQLVTKEDLFATVWAGLVVSDDSLVQAVSDLRRVLGDDDHKVIKTVPRRGYMLVGARPCAPEAPRAARRDSRSAGVALALFVLGIGLAWWRYDGSPDHVPASPIGHPSIAVLSFKTAPSGVDGEALGRQVAADLVTELARSPNLRVVASESSFRFTPDRTPLAEIGRRLRSRYLVDGTVRRDGDRLHVAVSLLDSEDSRVVWSVAQESDRTTMAAAQRALVRRIAGTLQIRVSRTEERRALAQPPKTLDVYVLTARGKAMMLRYSAEGLRQARHYFAQALKIDPDYAPAWAFLGTADVIDIGLHLTGRWDRSRAGEMLAHLQRAIALDPELPTAYISLSQAQGLLGHVDAALAAAERCRQVSPNEAGCFASLGMEQLRIGRSDAAVRNFERALDLDPIPPAYLPAFYATALWASGRLDDTIRVDDDCLARAPDFWRCRQDRIAALVELGRVGEAREEAARLQARVPGMTVDRFGMGFAQSADALRQRRMAAARIAGVRAGHSN